MAFLFRTSKKNQYRNLSSRDGPPSSLPSNSNGPQRQHSRDEKGSISESVPSSSLNSGDNDVAQQSPERKFQGRQRGYSVEQSSSPSQPPHSKTSDLPLRNIAPQQQQQPQQPSPSLNASLYPWSQKKFLYTSNKPNPYPRYGAAVNSIASKEGDIYVMGGLVNSTTVLGDLWLIEAGGNMSCYPLSTAGEGPGPRVGHASLLVGNAFIVFGGDTKVTETDLLDETLYLLNTTTRQWSRALPAGPRPTGRYGHSLNILGSKIYIFGGQIEGHFMNDLSAFDLNQLQMPNNRWDILNLHNDATSQAKVPPARTNHTMITFNDKLYLFGGTNGFEWFNDVWSYDPPTKTWSLLDCIGYIPVPREGHAAALVDDFMYIFGGRTEEGVDLGDLAAFRITSRRWYTFHNMGPSPSPRSGHSMTTVGKTIVVVGGEPSSVTTPVNDLSIVYCLDTAKIRFPNSSGSRDNSQRSRSRRPSAAADTRNLPPSRDGPPTADPRRAPDGRTTSPTNNAAVTAGITETSKSGGPAHSSIPETTAVQRSPPSGPLPPRPPLNSAIVRAHNEMEKNQAQEPPLHQKSPLPRDQIAPIAALSPEPAADDKSNKTKVNNNDNDRLPLSQPQPQSPTQPQELQQPPPPPSSSQSTRLDPTPEEPSQSDANTASAPASTNKAQSALKQTRSSPVNGKQSDAPSKASTSVSVPASATPNLQSSPPRLPKLNGNSFSRRSSARNSQTVTLLKELDLARNRNAWYASEIELARKAGYQPSTSLNLLLDNRASETFDDDDKPLIEALLAMRAELGNVQASIDSQAELAAKCVAEAEKQRDSAIQEAVYVKAKLAAHFNGTTNSPSLDSEKEGVGYTDDRVAELNRKLASVLATQKELHSNLERVIAQLATETKGRQLADETARAAQQRMSELESYKQATSLEIERLKAELHAAQYEARQQAVATAEATAAMELARIDQKELQNKYAHAVELSNEHSETFDSLRDAITASAEMKNMLERKLDDERLQREKIEAKLIRLKAEYEARMSELVGMTKRVRDMEELAEKQAAEARLHRQAVLSGLEKMTATGPADKASTLTDDRVVALQGQLNAANVLVRKYQQQADEASDRVRSAEERIAGLEAYQEQASREGVQFRRQLQAALRETQTLQAANSELKAKLANQELETNAMTVQHNTLKDILSERGISPTSVAARVRNSINFATHSPRAVSPDVARLRDVEQQLVTSIAAHEETKSLLAQREQESESAYREKLVQLENDYQSAVQYVKGTEKMLKQLKDQMSKYKAENTRLKEQVIEMTDEAAEAAAQRAATNPADVEAQRAKLQAQISALEHQLQDSSARLNEKLAAVRRELVDAQRERAAALEERGAVVQRLTSSQDDLARLQIAHRALEQRAQDAERKVSMLLETSVDHHHYRRRSRTIASQASISSDTTAAPGGGNTPEPAASLATAPTNGVVTREPNGLKRRNSDTGSIIMYGGLDGARNSAALDDLANELETMRSRWESTNKHYRLSSNYEFDSAATTPTGLGKKSEAGLGLSESLADWRQKLDDGSPASARRI